MPDLPPHDELVFGKPNDRNSVPLEERHLIGPTTADGNEWTATDEDKSKSFVRFLIDTLQIDTSHNPPILDGEMTPEHVEAIAHKAMRLWPRDQGIELGTPATRSHGVLYWGRGYPSDTIRMVKRSCLYCDRIYLSNRYINSYTFHPEIGPLARPADHMKLYAYYAITLAALQKWIESGFVVLISNPMYTNWRLRTKFRTTARARIDRDQLVARHSRHPESWGFSLAFSSNEFISRFLARHKDEMDAGEEDRIRLFLTQLHDSDPILQYVRSLGSAGFINGGVGITGESAAYISGLRGLAIGTDSHLIADQIRSIRPQGNKKLQTIADAFAHLRLGFLENVDLDYALTLREQGAVRSFREYLSGVITQSAGGSITDMSEHDQKEAAEQLKHEYEEYKKDWSQIDANLVKTGFVGSVSAGVVAGGASAYATGRIEVLPTLATIVTSQTVALFGARRARKEFANRPLSVFFRVDHDR